MEEEKTISNFISSLESHYAILNGVEIDPPSKHDFFNKQANKTVTFLAANMGTSEGLYKNLIPATAINMHVPNMRAFIANMQEVDASKNPSDAVFPSYRISDEMVALSDYLVLPFLQEDITQMVKSYREINPNIKIAYQVDSNIFASAQSIPDTMSIKKLLKAKSGKELLLNNCDVCDMIFFSNDVVRNSYQKYLSEKGVNTNKKAITFYCRPFEYILGNQWKYFQQASVVADFILPEEQKFAQKFPKEETQLRFGIFLSPDNAYILEEFLPVIQSIYKKFGNRVQYVVVGLNEIEERSAIESIISDKTTETSTAKFLKEKIHPNLPKDIVCFHQRVPFHEYHALPYILNIDAVIMFAKDTIFNVGNINYIKYIEMAYMHLPVIASDVYPYNRFITSGDNGILIANDPQFWVQEVESLISQLDNKSENDMNKLDALEKLAYFKASSMDASTREVIAYYQEIFS